jgi:hypothetical protein
MRRTGESAVPLQPPGSPHLESVGAYGGHSERGHSDAHGDRQHRHTTTRRDSSGRRPGGGGSRPRPHGVRPGVHAVVHGRVECPRGVRDSDTHGIRRTAAGARAERNGRREQAVLRLPQQPGHRGGRRTARRSGLHQLASRRRLRRRGHGIDARHHHGRRQGRLRAPDACIIGQWGTVGGYTSIIAAPLSTGKCFIGQTRPIDF